MTRSRALFLALGLSLLLWTESAWAVFANVGSFCGEATTASPGSSWTFSASNQLDVGNLGIIVLATDNLSATDGNTNDHVSMWDGSSIETSNTWTKAREYTNGQGGAGNGVTVSIWYSKSGKNLGSTSNITVNFSGSITAKSATCQEFTMAAGKTVKVDGGNDRADDGSGTSDPGAITVSGLASIADARLWIRGTGQESNTNTYGAGSNYLLFGASLASSRTTGMGARAQYRIFTGTSDTSDPTGATNIDYASTMVAFSEVTCPAVPEVSYVTASASPGQVTLYWSSPYPVVVLRDYSFTIGTSPQTGTEYTAGDKPQSGFPRVVYDGVNTWTDNTGAGGGTLVCTATSCTNTSMDPAKVWYYMVFPKTGGGASTCYAAGTANPSGGIKVKPQAALAWSYTVGNGGAMMTPGVAGWDGSINTGSNAGWIFSVDTTSGAQRWAPVSAGGAVQGWLTWLPAGTGWSSGSWTKRKKITLQGAQVGAGGVADFPVLVYTTTDANLQASAQASGNDIVFTAADGETKLSHEIERYTPATGELIAWVKVPWLPSGANTDIYMYYGNPTAGDQRNARDVWSNGYVGVWHLQQDVGSGANGDIKDSTTRYGGTFYRNGTPAALTATDLVAPAEQKIGGALKFVKDPAGDGPNGTLVDMGNLPAFELSFYSWSMWIRAPNAVACGGTTTNQQPLFNADTQFQFNWGQADVTACQGGGHADTTGFKQSQISGPLLSANTWYHVAATYDGATVRIYLNGALKGEKAAGTPILTAGSGTFSVGDFAIGNRPPNKHRWEGQLDEVRVGSALRNDGWMLTEYNNQKDWPSSSTFLTVGAEEAGTWTPSTPCTSCSYLIGGDHSGRVFSADELTGQTQTGNLSAKANKIQAPVAAQLNAYANQAFRDWYWNTYSYAGDVLFVASYNDTSAAGCTGVNNTQQKSNKVFALKASDLTAAPLWVFNDVPCNTASDAMDYVSGMPYVNYGRNQLYVTSGPGGAASFWVLSSLNGARLGSLALGQIDMSPTLSGDRSTVYVATAGATPTLYAIAADATIWTTAIYPAGAVRWSLALGSAVRGFVWEVGGKVYFATMNGNVWCVEAGAQCSGWPAGGQPVGASGPPLLMNSYLYVGATDGKLHQLGLTDGTDVGTPFPTTGTLDETATLGSVTSETGSEVFVGTSNGRIFKIAVPLP